MRVRRHVAGTSMLACAVVGWRVELPRSKQVAVRLQTGGGLMTELARSVGGGRRRGEEVFGRAETSWWPCLLLTRTCLLAGLYERLLSVARDLVAR